MSVACSEHLYVALQVTNAPASLFAGALLSEGDDTLSTLAGDDVLSNLLHRFISAALSSFLLSAVSCHFLKAFISTKLFFICFVVMLLFS